MAASAGVGYLAQAIVQSVVYNLNDGSIARINRDWQHFVMPSLNFEFGRQIKPRLGWYNKYSLAYKLSSADTDAMLFFMELGLQFRLGK